MNFRFTARGLNYLLNTIKDEFETELISEEVINDYSDYNSDDISSLLGWKIVQERLSIPKNDMDSVEHVARFISHTNEEYCIYSYHCDSTGWNFWDDSEIKVYHKGKLVESS